MNFKRKGITLVGALLLGVVSSQAQVTLPSGLSGNVQIDVQSYKQDSLIGAPKVPEKVLSNAFVNLIYKSGNITAGLRYESYANVLQGYNARYNGNGIMYRFVEFTKDELTITAGSFYEQFGSGMVLRTYVEPGLGYDNSLDGVRAKYMKRGITIKGFIGRQRSYFTYGPGLVRGIDGEVNLNELNPKWANAKNLVSFGGSFVSKFQAANDPVYNLPENVGAWAARMNLNRGGFRMYAEYAHKINDPSLVNNFIYKDGEALYATIGYSKKGLGFSVSGKRIDNMNFRSDRSASLTNLNINYLPAITHQYTYRLATLYPFATQPNGEIGNSAELYYTFKPESALGGHYGTLLSINGTRVTNIVIKPTFDERGYTSSFFDFTSDAFYSDVNVEITKKISKKFKINLNYFYEQYNQAVIEGHPDTPMVYANIGVLEMLYKVNNKNSVRVELQHLYTKQDRGNWAFGLLEYSVSPNWSFNVFDEYNYGNPDASRQFHYPSGGIAYFKNSTRIAVGYGKQRAGLLCVGGVCRYVPASDGFSLSLTSSF